MSSMPVRDDQGPGTAGASACLSRSPARTQLQRLEALAHGEMVELRRRAQARPYPDAGCTEQASIAWDLGLDASHAGRAGP